MELTTVEARVVGVVSEVLKVPRQKITTETRFVEDLGADSLDLASMVLALEEEFDATLPDDRRLTLKTVGSVVDLVAAHVAT